jgi:hypothetical protein
MHFPVAQNESDKLASGEAAKQQSRDGMASRYPKATEFNSDAALLSEISPLLEKPRGKYGEI